MSLWVCTDCTTAYAVGLVACPHCGRAEYTEGDSVPKTTRLGGATIAGDAPEQSQSVAEGYGLPVDSFAGPRSVAAGVNRSDDNVQSDDTSGEASDEDDEDTELVEDEEDSPSPGSNSATSTDKHPTSGHSAATSDHSLAPTMDSHSSPQGGGRSSSALSTGGSTRATTSNRGSKK